MRCPGYVLIDGKSVALETIQSIFGAEPHKSFRILKYGIYSVGRETILRFVVFEI